jgi:type IV secretory pathway TraG/TraD family ATPase VirD4
MRGTTLTEPVLFRKTRKDFPEKRFSATLNPARKTHLLLWIMGSPLPLRLAQKMVPDRLHKLFGIKRSTLHGEARWMDHKEMGDFLCPRNTGLVFSAKYRMSLRDSFANIAVCAPTGSGKTTRFVIPNLLDVQGSAVVTDPSGEIFRLTSGHLQQRGFRIRVLQAADLSQSLRFNPMAYCRSRQDLRRLAATLAENSAGQDAFWTIGATNILYIGLCALANVEDAGYRNLANLRWILNHFGVNGEGINDFMGRYLDEVTFAEYKGFIAQDTKVISGMLSAARAALDLWSDPDVAELTAEDTMGMAAFRKQKTVIYLIVPEHKITYFSIILNLFYSMCFEHCLEHWNEADARENEALLPCFFFLDEFGNLGNIRNFSSIITTLRKRRCSVSIIFQELSQLEKIYGDKDARSIFSGGCGSKLFFSGMDTQMCDYVEKALGQNTEYDTLYQGISEHARTVAQPLMRGDEVRMMDTDRGVLLSGHQRPICFAMPRYFQVREWQALTDKGAASQPCFGSHAASHSASPMKQGPRIRYIPLGPQQKEEGFRHAFTFAEMKGVAMMAGIG